MSHNKLPWAPKAVETWCPPRLYREDPFGKTFLGIFPGLRPQEPPLPGASSFSSCALLPTLQVVEHPVLPCCTALPRQPGNFGTRLGHWTLLLLSRWIFRTFCPHRNLLHQLPTNLVVEHCFSDSSLARTLQRWPRALSFDFFFFFGVALRGRTCQSSLPPAESLALAPLGLAQQIFRLGLFQSHLPCKGRLSKVRSIAVQQVIRQELDLRPKLVAVVSDLHA